MLRRWWDGTELTPTVVPGTRHIFSNCFKMNLCSQGTIVLMHSPMFVSLQIVTQKSSKRADTNKQRALRQNENTSPWDAHAERPIITKTRLPCRRRPSSSAGAGGGGKRRDGKGKRRPQDKFSVAMESLHVTAVPKSLPCRNDERNQLLSFLTSNIKAGERAAAQSPLCDASSQNRLIHSSSLAILGLEYARRLSRVLYREAVSS